MKTRKPKCPPGKHPPKKRRIPQAAQSDKVLWDPPTSVVTLKNIPPTDSYEDAERLAASAFDARVEGIDEVVRLPRRETKLTNRSEKMLKSLQRQLGALRGQHGGNNS